jgi:hypothetical protein
VSRWQLKLPGRPTDSLAQLGFNASVLPSEDRRITRLAAVVGARAGVTTTGELIRLWESFTPEERRHAYDRLREAADLQSATKTEYREEATQRNLMAQANPRTVDLRLSESGAIVDVADAQREASREAIAAARREAEREARRSEAQTAPGPQRWPKADNLL